MAGKPAAVARVDSAIQSARSAAEAFGGSYIGRVVIHYLHVSAFLVLVMQRDHTTLPLLRWIAHQCGGAFHGVPALALQHAATGFDTGQGLYLKIFGL